MTGPCPPLTGPRAARFLLRLAPLPGPHRKVLHKLRLGVSETDIRRVVAGVPRAVEPILWALREKVQERVPAGARPLRPHGCVHVRLERKPVVMQPDTATPAHPLAGAPRSSHWRLRAQLYHPQDPGPSGAAGPWVARARHAGRA